MSGTRCPRLLIFGLSSLIAILLQGLSWGLSSECRTLKGLQGVYVSVEKLDPAVEMDGLTADALQKEISDQIQKAGIKAFTREEWFNIPGAPSLHVNLHVVKLPSTGEYIYSIHMGVKQEVYLAREPIPAAGATTWALGAITGITSDLGKIRDSLQKRTLLFISDYQAANAK